MRDVGIIKKRDKNMKKIINQIFIFIISGVLFFVFTAPFHKLLEVFTVSEVRVSAVLYPLLGINFGFPSAFAIAIANLLIDIRNGYSLNILIIGFFFQILYTMAPYYIWRYFVKNDEHKHRLDSVKRVLQFTFVCFVSAILAASFIGYFCMKSYNLDFFQVAIFVFLNNFEISIMLGCPLSILINQIISRKHGADRTVTLNERIIIVSTIVEVIVLFALIFIVYSNDKTISTYDIWNTIYFYILRLMAFLFIVILMVMIIFENKSKKKI